MAASLNSRVSDNAPRYRQTAAGHVESYFLRANHPTEPRAIWLKITVLRNLDGSAVAEAWCALFDGDRTFAAKHTVDLGDARFSGTPLEIRVAGCSMRLGDAGGSAAGSVRDVVWNLDFDAGGDSMGRPLCLFPSRRLISGAFPKSKLLTPSPELRFSGTVRWGDETWDVSDWFGMQGHNWGKQHALEYVWGQVLFAGANGETVAMAEAFSGKIKVGPMTTPFISALVVRRGDATYRFDRLVDLWRQKVVVDDIAWTATFRGSDGEATLSMRADPRQMVCLGYRNPDGALSYCLNSKLARSELRVNPTNDEAFWCESVHGGALEFLRRAPDPRFGEVV
jgi:hypothetical protein